MRKTLVRWFASIGALLALAGCVVYEPYPVGYSSGPSTFDRSWSAAGGALQDQGVQITSQDRATGVIQGRRGGINVTARVVTQADGKVRVEFNHGGALSEDPG